MITLNDTLGRNPLDEVSACRRDFYFTTHNTKHSQETDIHALAGFRTRNFSKRAATGIGPYQIRWKEITDMFV
jgi:hypothetical protein